MGFRDLWALDPRSHSRFESLAGKEACAGGLLPDPDPEWTRMLPVVPEPPHTIRVRAFRRGQDRRGNSETGVSTSPSTLVPTILRGQMEWDATAKFAAPLVPKHRIAERERLGLDT